MVSIDRIEAEAAGEIRAFNDRLRDFVGEPYLVVDDGGRVVSVNRAYCEVFVLDREDAEGLPVERLPGLAETAPAIAALLDLARGAEAETVHQPLTLALPASGRTRVEVVAFRARPNLVAMLLVMPARTTAGDAAGGGAAGGLAQLHHCFSIARSVISLGEVERPAADQRTVIAERLDVLLGAVDLLLSEGAAEGELRTLHGMVLRVIGIVRPEPLLTGPPVHLNLLQSLTFALLLHDVARAMIGGDAALTGPALGVEWSLGEADAEGPVLLLSWRRPIAVGEPRVEDPRLARQLATFALNGSLTLKQNASEVACLIDVPINAGMRAGG